MATRMATRARMVLVLWLAASLSAACSPGRRQAAPSPSSSSTGVHETLSPTPAGAPTSPLAPVGPTGHAGSPAVTGSAVFITRGSPDRRSVFLTFDAGADTGYAAQILDT